MIVMAGTRMLQAALLTLCFAVAAQGQCLTQCLALPCEDAEHTASAPTATGSCHDAGSGSVEGSGPNPAAPEPSENEDCGNHSSCRTVSASRFDNVAAKTTKLAASLEALPTSTHIPAHRVLGEESASLANPLLPYVRSTVLLI